MMLTGRPSPGRADPFREYLDTLDEAAWGAASETVPKFISRSDPAAQWTGAHKGHAFFAYADNYLIDLKAAIIVDVDATRAIRQAEVGAARIMIERTEDRLGLCPERLAADSAYGSAEMLGSLTSMRSSRTFRCSTSRLATMGRSLAKTSPTIRNTISTSVLPARC
jgi:hypothetical protein